MPWMQAMFILPFTPFSGSDFPPSKTYQTAIMLMLIFIAGFESIGLTAKMCHIGYPLTWILITTVVNRSSFTIHVRLTVTTYRIHVDSGTNVG